MPGDYLMQMKPWNVETSAEKNSLQWNALQFDSIAQFYPWRVYYARSMQEGKLPLWNPYQFCGTPFSSNGQSAVFYPGNLLFLIFSSITAITIFAALHLWFAQTFMYLLLRELRCSFVSAMIGAVCFAFCAFMVLWLELPTFISAAVYLPLTILLIIKAIHKHSALWGLISGVSLAFAFLAGHLQIAFYVAFAAILCWIWGYCRLAKSEGRFDAVLILTIPFLTFLAGWILISAPQVLPSIELAPYSHRASVPTDDGYQHFIHNGLKPWRFVTAFIPDYYGNPAKGDYAAGSAADYIEYGFYGGIITLLLAVCGLWNIRRRYVGYFVLMAVIALFTAVGSHLNYLFYFKLPGFSSFGGPQRILILYFFSIAALAAFGLDFIIDRLRTAVSPKFVKLSNIILAALIAFSLVISAFCVSYMIAKNTFADYTTSAPLNLIIGFSVLWLLLIGVNYKKRISSDTLSWLMFVIITLDLFAFGIGYNPTCSRKKVYPETELTKAIIQIAPKSRVAIINSKWNLYKTPGALLPPNSAMVYGFYDVSGYDSLYLKDYKAKLAEIIETDPSPPENGNMVLVRKYNDKLSEIADYVISENPVASDQIKEITNADGIHIYKYINSKANLKVNEIPKVFNLYSLKLGLFMMLLGIASIGCAFVTRTKNKK